jgi:hypothetical protein
MSFLDDIVDTGKSVIGVFSGDSTGATLARTALLAYGLNQLNKNNQPGTVPAAPDLGVRLQVNPDPEHKIPVIYGQAFLGGIITDAEIANNNNTMYYCITICEKTGNKLSDGLTSQISFNDIYWNDQRIVFDTDGITAAYTVDRDSNVDYSVANQVKVYCFSGSSSSPVVPVDYTNLALTSAYSIMPNWTSNHTMNDLIFAIVRVDYNKEKNITSLPTVTFDITNNMTQPGDCIYDYMTNTRYGAGINPSDIYGA